MRYRLLLLHVFWSFAAAGLLAGCHFDETPADIGMKLLPVISQELITQHSSSRLNGVSPQITNALAAYPPAEITYKIETPDASSETGICFYSKKDNSRFLAIGLNLNASMKAYNINFVSEERIPATSP